MCPDEWATLVTSALVILFLSPWCSCEREREEVVHLSSHTELMQVLPGHPLADPKR